MKGLMRPTSMQGVHHTAALFGVATAFLVLFALLVLGVVDGWPVATFDQGVLALVRMLPDPPADAVMVFATYLASWQVIVAGTAGCVIVFVVSRPWAWSWTLLVSVVGDQLIVSAAKAVVGRVRPDHLDDHTFRRKGALRTACGCLGNAGGCEPRPFTADAPSLASAHLSGGYA